jgi:hypothetical protein
MGDRSSISSPNRFPLAAAQALVVILAVESAIFIYRDSLMSALNLIAREKRDLLVRESSQEEVAVFGDSQAFSISPAVVAKSLGCGIGVTNYAWPYAGWEVYDLVLDAYLRRRGPPRAILVSFMPIGLALPEEFVRLEGRPEHLPRVFNLLPGGFLVSRFAVQKRWAGLWDWFTYTVAPPSARYRGEILSAARSLKRGDRDRERLAAERRMLADWRSKGAFALFDSETAPETVLEDFEGFVGGLARRPSPPVHLLEEFLDRADANGIPVILLNPPVSERMFARLSEIGVLTAYDEIIARWRREHSNLRIVEPLVQVYPNDRFGDVGHLNSRGDAEFQRFYDRALGRLALGLEREERNSRK